MLFVTVDVSLYQQYSVTFFVCVGCPAIHWSANMYLM